MKLCKRVALVLFIAFLSLSLGCLAWEPGWKLAASSGIGNAAALLAKAKRLENEAGTKEKVEELVDAFEDVVKADPRNLEALKGLGKYYFLLGYGHSGDVESKKANYVKALQYNERAMYANPAFRALANGGAPVWEGCRALGKNDMDAMFYWYLTAGNCWKECYGFLGRLVNFSMPGRMMKVLERMTEVDQSWNSGSILFCWAVYYAAVPGPLGGNMEKSEDFFDRAMKAGPRMTDFYMARAVYFHAKKKDREAFVRDLRTAIAIDPRRADTLEYPFAVYNRERAKQLLGDTDLYFK